MRTQRFALARNDGTAVHRRGHPFIWSEEPDVVGILLTEWWVHSGLFRHCNNALELGPRKRRVVELLDPPGLPGILVHRREIRGFYRQERRGVRLDVIGVTVPTIAVIGDHNLRTESADLRHDVTALLGDRCHPERV